MSVKIMTDSTSYIEEDIRKDLDIKIASLHVNFKNKNLKETEIENEEFYKMMEEEEFPLSSQPTIGEIYKDMVDIVSKGHDLLCVFLSSDMSGTYNSALKVREKVLEEYEDASIEIIDSRSNSMQLGFAAIVGARAAKEGKSLEEIKEIVEANIVRSRFLFIPEDLEHLKKGGRIGGGSALIGNMLKIIPVLTVEDGKTSVFKTVRTKRRAINAMVDKTLQDHRDFNIKEIIVHHINCHDQALELVDSLKKNIDMNISIVDIGPVIGLHVGPGAIAVAYYTEDEL